MSLQMQINGDTLTLYHSQVTKENIDEVVVTLQKTSVEALILCGNTIEDSALSTLFEAIVPFLDIRMIRVCHNSITSKVPIEQSIQNLVISLEKNINIFEFILESNTFSGSSCDAEILKHVQPIMQKRMIDVFQAVISTLQEKNLSKGNAYIVLRYFFGNKEAIYQGKVIPALLGHYFPSISDVLLNRVRQNESMLNTLTLSSQEINNEDLVQLVFALRNNTTVTKIDLNDNNIGDEGGKLLAELIVTNKNIHHLEIQGNCIQNEGALAFVSALEPNNHALQTFLIAENLFDDNTAVILSDAIKKSTKTTDYLYTLVSQTDVKNRKEDCTIEGLALIKRFSNDPSSLLEASTYNREVDTAIQMSFDLFDHLAECHCGIALNRRGELDYRKKLEHLFLEHHEARDKNKPFRIASVASGTLFQESVLIAKLLEQGYSDIHLDLIDTDYVDVKLAIDANGYKFLMASQFIHLLYKMGLNVKSGSNIQEPLLIQKYGFDHFVQYYKKNQTNAEAETPCITITFFDSVDNYAKHLSQNLEQPSALLMVDLDKGSYENQIVKPILDAVRENTLFYTIQLLWHDASHTRRDCYKLDVRRKVNNQWTSILGENTFTVKVDPNDPFLLLQQGPPHQESISSAPQVPPLVFSDLKPAANAASNQSADLANEAEGVRRFDQS